MWTPTGAQIVLWLHVLAACVWIGGQVTIALLLPVLRPAPELLRTAGRRYQIVAWSAFALLILTGLANIHNAHISTAHLTATAEGRTLTVKLLFVLLSGLAAAVHAVGPRLSGRPFPSRVSATLGIVSLLSAVVAALYGVTIAEHASG